MDTLSAAMLLLWSQLRPLPLVYDHRPLAVAQTTIPLNPVGYTYIRLGGDLYHLDGIDSQPVNDRLADATARYERSK